MNRKPLLNRILVLTGLFLVVSSAASAADVAVTGSGERGGITLTVGAVKHDDDGVSTGNATFHDRNTNSKIRIEVTSISIHFTDKLATIVGEVTKSTGNYALGFPVGSRVTFQVEDEGESSGTIPDGFTLPVRIGAGTPTVPPSRGDGGLLPASERGNFQVCGIDDKSQVQAS